MAAAAYEPDPDATVRRPRNVLVDEDDAVTKELERNRPPTLCQNRRYQYLQENSKVRIALDQRKFAQGAYNTCLLLTRASHQNGETCPAAKNISSSSSSLLDAISFKEMYLRSRLQPTVVLDRLTWDRLRNAKMATGTPSTLAPDPSSPPEPSPRAARRPLPPYTKPITRSKAKKTIQQKKDIRLHVVKTRRISRNMAAKLKKPKEKDDSDIQGNRSLTHFAKNVSRKGRAANNKTEMYLRSRLQPTVVLDRLTWDRLRNAKMATGTPSTLAPDPSSPPEPSPKPTTRSRAKKILFRRKEILDHS